MNLKCEKITRDVLPLFRKPGGKRENKPQPVIVWEENSVLIYRIIRHGGEYAFEGYNDKRCDMHLS